MDTQENNEDNLKTPTKKNNPELIKKMNNIENNQENLNERSLSLNFEKDQELCNKIDLTPKLSKEVRILTYF